MTGKAVATLLAAALLASGCGGEKEGGLIPAAKADQMLDLLEKADAQSANGTCGGAGAKAKEAEETAQSLSNRVDKDTRRRLTDGLARLRELIAEQCKKPERTDTTPETVTETVPTETTPTQTTPTQTTPTTPTETTPTETTPTETTPTTTTGTGGTPPGDVVGQGDGNGGEETG